MWTICLMVALVIATAFATDKPIIGLLTQEVPPEYFKNYTAYLPASYVKAVEASGGRVVPISIGKPEEYYEDILSKINGVVFPGGGSNFTTPKGYGEAGTYIYNIATKMNNQGDYFPIMGVCLGYELLMYIASGDYNILTQCKSQDPLALHFRTGYTSSRLYKKAPSDIINILQTLPVTSNHHQNCVTVDNIKKHRLDKEWLVLSTNKDQGGIEFVSSSESVRYPFVGLQFHPEKNAYEWNPTQKNPHSRKAVYSARYFYDWIVSEARLNNHRFKSDKEEINALIYNYNPFYMGKENGYDEQVYLFDE